MHTNVPGGTIDIQIFEYAYEYTNSLTYDKQIRKNEFWSYIWTVFDVTCHSTHVNSDITRGDREFIYNNEGKRRKMSQICQPQLSSLLTKSLILIENI